MIMKICLMREILSKTREETEEIKKKKDCDFSEDEYLENKKNKSFKFKKNNF